MNMAKELECEWCKSAYTMTQSNAMEPKRYCSTECEQAAVADEVMR